VPAPLRGPDLARPLRVALVVDPGGHGVAPQVEDGLLKAAAALTDAGYVVDAIEPPAIDAAAGAALEMLASDLVVSIEFMTTYPPPILGVLRALIELAGSPDRLRGMAAYMTRQAVLRRWGAFLEEHPLVVAPVFTGVPFLASEGYGAGEVEEIVHGLRMTIAVNALGLPAVVLPVASGTGSPRWRR
jgi:amidase